MENKELRNALVNAIKNELKDFTQIQKDLKKSRKLEFRPKDKSLQEIVDEINRNASKISTLIFHYRWVRHGLKYWNNRDVQSFKDYYILDYYDGDKETGLKQWETEIKWGSNAGKTHGDLNIEYAKNFFITKCNEYSIEISENNVNYLMQNI